MRKTVYHRTDGLSTGMIHHATEIYFSFRQTRGILAPGPPVTFCMNKKLPKNHLNLRFKNPSFFITGVIFLAQLSCKLLWQMPISTRQLLAATHVRPNGRLLLLRRSACRFTAHEKRRHCGATVKFSVRTVGSRRRLAGTDVRLPQEFARKLC